MAGIIVGLLISWLLLWFFEKKHLSVLGFTPTRNRLTQFVWGLAIAALFCTVYNFLTKAFISNKWVLNKRWSDINYLSVVWWVFRSVLFEELVFRGALFYIAIKKLGVGKACILSAICFGIYHWFSFGVLGSPVQMIFVFLATAIAGWMFAFAFAKTASLYLPIALHLGWNLINIILFSNGPLGRQILVPANDTKLDGGLSLLIFVFQVIGLPLFIYWYVQRQSKWKAALA